MLIYQEHSNDTIDLSLDFYGYEDCTPAYSFGPSIRDNYVLHYVTKGKGCFYYQNVVHHLQAGDIFLLKPNETTFYQADEEEPWSYCWLGISGTKAADYFNLSQVNQTAVIYKTESIQTKALGNLILDTIYLAETSQQTLGNHLIHYSKLYLILHQLIQLVPNPQIQRPDEQQMIYQQVKQYIDRYYHLQISVQEMADEFNIHRSYMSVIFKKYAAQSPKEYLTSVRMKRARQLLEQTTEPIKAIAYSVGYQDPLVFSKVYKNHFGMSPKQFRQKNTHSVT